MKIQCPCTMRSVLHLTAGCLLTILVAVSADVEVFQSLTGDLQGSNLDPLVKPQAAEVPEKQVNENLQSTPPPILQTLEENNRKEEQESKPEEQKNEPQPENVNEKGPSTTLEELIRKEQVDEAQSESLEVEKADEGNTNAERLSLENPSEEDAEALPKVSYNGVKVLRVVLQNKEQRKMIKQLENKGDINTWSGNGSAVDILIRQDSVFNVLKDKKLIYDVIIDDLQKAIEEENPQIPQDEWSELEGRKGHRMTWQMYHRMSDIHGYIDYLTATYPDMCSQETIGYSVEGRPLKVLKISSGEENSRAMWVDSGIHAREWITPATSTYAISQMVENGDGTHGVDWYFLPLVNPDGYEHSHTTDRLWRKNRADSYKGPCAGTDLNRNFGYRWGGQGSSQQPCRETYAGPSAFSEPETNAINKFVLSKSKDLKAYVSLHSYGQYILYPWGYDRKVPPDYSDLHRVGRAMANAMRRTGGQIYRVGSAAATLYPASGGSDDWAKGTAKIKYAYTIELRDTGRHGFVLPAQYIQPTAMEAYAALKTLAEEVKQL